jgi:hypothetical protein
MEIPNCRAVVKQKSFVAIAGKFIFLQKKWKGISIRSQFRLSVAGKLEGRTSI